MDDIFIITALLAGFYNFPKPYQLISWEFFIDPAKIKWMAQNYEAIVVFF
jgi:hypothetical protein